MATYYGVNADYLLVDNPSARPNPGEQGGVKRVIFDTFELSADLVGGTDQIYMGGLIPKGARILDVKLFFDDLDASGGTLNVGWLASDDAAESADADGFLAAVDVTSAGTVSMFEDQSTVAGMHKKFTAPVQCVIAPVGDTDATSGTISIEIDYILD